MKEVDRIAKDVGKAAENVGKAAENVGDDLLSAVRDLTREVRKLTQPEPRIPPAIVALVAIGIVALVVAIVGGARLAESKAQQTEPYS